MAFEFHERDAIAKMGVARRDQPSDDDRAIVEPERDLNAQANCEGHHHLNVAAAATEVGGLEVHRNAGAFDVDFDLHLDGITRMQSAFAFGKTVG